MKNYILVCIIFFASCSNGSLKKEKIDWMQKTCDIELKETFLVEEFYNNHEWGVIAKFRMSEEETKGFINDNNLVIKEINDIQMLMIEDVESDWYDENFNIKREGVYYFVKDCKVGNNWKLLIDEKTNNLWFEVTSPDNGGDISDCN